MSKLSVKKFDSPKTQAIGVAKNISGKLNSFITEKGSANIALSGGSTPQLYLERLSKVFTGWQKVHIFWSDERCVPPNSAESNYNMIKENFLQLIDIPSINIHRIRGEDEPDEEASRYSNEILDWVPAANGLPCFDLIMLGVGTDGHTASIFPGQMELFDSDKICAATVQPVTGQRRITLTGNAINNAKSIFMVASGEAKAMIVKEILGNESSNYPAGRIIPLNGKLDWFLDKEAAGLLHLKLKN